MFRKNRCKKCSKHCFKRQYNTRTFTYRELRKLFLESMNQSGTVHFIDFDKALTKHYAHKEYLLERSKVGVDTVKK